MGKALSVPKYVRDTVRALWPNDKEHAAKHIAVWLLDVVGFGNHDEDTGLNVSLKVGRLLERHKNDSADEFIKAVQQEFHNL